MGLGQPKSDMVPLQLSLSDPEIIQEIVILFQPSTSTTCELLYQTLGKKNIAAEKRSSTTLYNSPSPSTTPWRWRELMSFFTIDLMTFLIIIIEFMTFLVITESH